MKFSTRMKWGERFLHWNLPALACFIGWHAVKDGTPDSRPGAPPYRCIRCKLPLGFGLWDFKKR